MEWFALENVLRRSKERESLKCSLMNSRWNMILLRRVRRRRPRTGSSSSWEGGRGGTLAASLAITTYCWTKNLVVLETTMLKESEDGFVEGEGRYFKEEYHKTEIWIFYIGDINFWIIRNHNMEIRGNHMSFPIDDVTIMWWNSMNVEMRSWCGRVSFWCDREGVGLQGWHSNVQVSERMKSNMRVRMN